MQNSTMSLPSSRQGNLLTCLYWTQIAEVLVKCPGATAVAVSLPSAPGPATDNHVSLTVSLLTYCNTNLRAS